MEEALINLLAILSILLYIILQVVKIGLVLVIVAVIMELFRNDDKGEK